MLEDRIGRNERGIVANRRLLEQSALFEPRLYRVTDRIHCVVGLGLSNATLIIAPEGNVVVDTGEGIEEAKEQLAEFDKVSTAPYAAALYTHSHYCFGTAAYVERARDAFRVYAHEDVERTIENVGAEIGPAYLRRLMVQFGRFLPTEGEDAMPNFGIGPFYFHPSGRRSTLGFVAPTDPISQPTTATIAGLRFDFQVHASDSEDTIFVHVPEEKTVIHNHVWPVLYNVYTLRGERYRDPQVVIAAIDAIRDLAPEHLVSTHGPPISGRDNVEQALLDHRDTLQLLWDQTVRGINHDLSPDDLTSFVRLPKRLRESRFVPETYGEVPFHVRAIHNGLLGWFGNDAATLHPPTPDEEAARIVDGFGGLNTVLEKVAEALEDGDPRWAAKLASHALRFDPECGPARTLKARALRRIAQLTTAANTRAFCLTQALELEGAVDVAGSLRLNPSRGRVLAATPQRWVAALRVHLDPVTSSADDLVARFVFTDKACEACLHVVGGVARYSETPPRAPDLVFRMSHPAFAELVAGRRDLDQLATAEDLVVDGGHEQARTFLRRFDLFP